VLKLKKNNNSGAKGLIHGDICNVFHNIMLRMMSG
jgi:hypothetical protein